MLGLCNAISYKSCLQVLTKLCLRNMVEITLAMSSYLQTQLAQLQLLQFGTVAKVLCCSAQGRGFNLRRGGWFSVEGQKRKHAC